MADGPIRQQIIDKLTQAFDPVSLEVIDESHLHAGHAGAGEESHIRLFIVSAAFAGLGKPARWRLVHKLLAAEWQKGLHALVLRAYTPQEKRGGDSRR